MTTEIAGGAPIQRPVRPRVPKMAQWTRHGCCCPEWWSLRGYEARKESGAWVLWYRGEKIGRSGCLIECMGLAA